MLLWGRVEKTNKSEIWNRLTYRVLIYIFEVGMKTFFSQMRNFEVEIPIWIFFWKKRPFFLFLRLEAEFFLSPCYHARHLQQIHWFKIFCRTYDLVMMLSNYSDNSDWKIGIQEKLENMYYVDCATLCFKSVVLLRVESETLLDLFVMWSKIFTKRRFWF